MGSVVLGVDVGTSSTKGVLVDEDGKVLISTTRTHRPVRPRPAHVEMDARIWWTEFTSIAQELLGSEGGHRKHSSRSRIERHGPVHTARRRSR
jgi:sugar (pentulose or hexulose) kinase